MLTVREEMSKELRRQVVEPTPQQLLEELEANATRVEAGQLQLDKDHGIAGDNIAFSGNFAIPEVAAGNYNVRLKLESAEVSKELAIARLVVDEKKDVLTASDVQQHYQAAFGEVKAGAWKFADDKYRVANGPSIKEIVDQDMIDQFKYERTWFDCDDYAIALHGALHHHKHTAGMAIFNTWVLWESDGNTYGHAVVSFDEGGEVVIVEPQNDSFFTVPEKWQLWLLFG